MSDTFHFLKVKCPFLFPAISRQPFGLRGREVISLAPKKCTDAESRCVTMAFLCHSPALPRVPLHPIQFLICLSYNPSNLAYKRKDKKALSKTEHRCTPERLTRVCFTPFAKSLLRQPLQTTDPPTQSEMPTSYGPLARAVNTQDPLFEVQHVPPKIYLRPPCHKSLPLQRLTTHSRGFAA